eukprot:3047458-Rhodomonas_salina.1
MVNGRHEGEMVYPVPIWRFPPLRARFGLAPRRPTLNAPDSRSICKANEDTNDQQRGTMPGHCRVLAAQRWRTKAKLSAGPESALDDFFQLTRKLRRRYHSTTNTAIGRLPYASDSHKGGYAPKLKRLGIPTNRMTLEVEVGECLSEPHFWELSKA